MRYIWESFLIFFKVWIHKYLIVQLIIQLPLRQITSFTSGINIYFVLLSLIYKLFIKSIKWLISWNQLLIIWTISEMSDRSKRHLHGKVFPPFERNRLTIISMNRKEGRSCFECIVKTTSGEIYLSEDFYGDATFAAAKRRRFRSSYVNFSLSRKPQHENSITSLREIMSAVNI